MGGEERRLGGPMGSEEGRFKHKMDDRGRRRWRWRRDDEETYVVRWCGGEGEGVRKGEDELAEN